MNELIEKGLRLCKEIGGETYIVGGAVRDMVMNKPISDVDIATNVDIEDICKRFVTHNIGKNKDFGIVVVIWENESFEVAHFRIDGVYSDGRRPDDVKFTQYIEEDLARRDFTINAMAYDGEEIIDPYGGRRDIDRGVIKFVGDAHDRIREDGLRVLRAYRFAARFKFQLDNEKAYADFDLSRISQERITEEIRKCAWYGGKQLAFFMDRTKRNGIILIPEIQLNEHPHQVKHHPEGNVFQHIISCLCQSDTENGRANLAILFHDIGKGKDFKEIDGIPTFYGHDKTGAEMMGEVGARLKLSSKEIDLIKFICANHMIWWDLPKMKKSRVFDVALHPDYAFLLMVCEADEMSRLYMGDINKFAINRETITDMIEAARSKDEYDQLIKGFVDGNKIMKLRACHPKEIGVIKKAAIDYVIEKNFNVSQEEVDLFITRYDV